MKKEALLLMLLLLTVPMVYAQEDIVGTITDIIVQFSGVIFIIIFIIILMLVAGVFPKVRFGVGGIPWASILLLVLIVLLFLVPQYIPYPVDLSVPDNFKVYAMPAPAADALAMLGLPREWVSYVPAVIYMFVLPFAAIFALVWAFLVSLAIFTHVSANVNRLLAFIIAFMTIPVGWYVKIVWVLFSFMGIWSVAVFAATFIVGVFFRGAGIARKEYAEYTKYERFSKQAKDFDEWSEKIIDALRDRGVKGEAIDGVIAIKKQLLSDVYSGHLTEKGAKAQLERYIKSIR